MHIYVVYNLIIYLYVLYIVPIASVSFDKEFMKVIGEVDAANLTMQLRKKKIDAEIDTVETPKPKPKPAEPKKEEKKDDVKQLLNWSYPMQ